MNKRELVLNFFSGNLKNYVPVTAYYHFGQQHLSGNILADLEIEFYKKFNPDILKVMNDYSFITPEKFKTLNNKEFIYNLIQNDYFIKQYTEQIIALKKIVNSLKEEVVIWDTVFNPWFTIMRHILFKDISSYMKIYKDELHILLNYVTDSLIHYIENSIETGVDGIFYSVPASQYFLNTDEYNEFMKPYDRKIISAVKDKTDIFTLHLHGTGNIYYEDVIQDYSFDCFSWSDKNTSLDLKKAKKIIKAPLMGGIDEANEFNFRPYQKLEKEIDESISLMKGHQFILAPGCALQPQCPTERMQHYFEYSRSKQSA